jgi:hypothetical protein
MAPWMTWAKTPHTFGAGLTAKAELSSFTATDRSFTRSSPSLMLEVLSNLPAKVIANSSPSVPIAAGRIKRPRDHIQTLQRSGLVWKMPAGPHAPSVAGTDRLDRVYRADHPPDLHHVILQKRHELRSGGLPEPHDCRISMAPLGRELREPLLRGLLGRGRVDRLEGLDGPVLPGPRRRTDVCAEG